MRSGRDASPSLCLRRKLAQAALCCSLPMPPGCRLVVVLERVQGGLIGQTLSRYGVAGLYTVVVLSVGECSRAAGGAGAWWHLACGALLHLQTSS